MRLTICRKKKNRNKKKVDLDYFYLIEYEIRDMIDRGLN